MVGFIFQRVREERVSDVDDPGHWLAGSVRGRLRETIPGAECRLLQGEHKKYWTPQSCQEIHSLKPSHRMLKEIIIDIFQKQLLNLSHPFSLLPRQKSLIYRP